MDITEIQDELLRLEYPNLLPDHDPDIERYYYLRSIGRAHDALVIFQNRLIVRYPDNDFRTWLLRSYRSRDPAFRSLLARGYRMLAARSLERIKQILFIIAEKADAFNEKDIYSTIKTAEEILQFLSPERYEAAAGMDRFLRFATVMDYKVKSVTKASELVRAYLNDTLSIVEEERRRRSDAIRHAEEENRKRLVQADWDSYHYQKKYGAHSPFADLSAVDFSQEDLARIEVPAFNRVEDQILGYCIKYWNNIEDPAFERILFLYSRKYGKKNYDVYTAIRRGQMAKRRDDEILSSIMGVLVTGYYYSVQGDLYLQRNWNAIKFTLINQGQLPPKAVQKALPSPSGTAKKKPEQENSQAVKKTPDPDKTIPQQIEAKESKAKVKRPKAKHGAKTYTKQKSAKKAAVLSKVIIKPKSRAIPKIAPKPVKTARPAAVIARPMGTRSTDFIRTRKVKVPQKLKPAEQTRTTIISKPVVQAKPAPVPIKPVQPINAKPAVKMPTIAKPEVIKPAVITPSTAKPAIITPSTIKPAVKRKTEPKLPEKPKVFSNKTLDKAKGSVSDRLKELSGRSYDVYEDRFLSKARSAIRKILGAGKGLFFTLPEEAEDLVYNFLRDHYSDPYMDWESSADKKNLMTMGFDLPSINPVIDECYKNL